MTDVRTLLIAIGAVIAIASYFVVPKRPSIIMLISGTIILFVGVVS